MEAKKQMFLRRFGIWIDVSIVVLAALAAWSLAIPDSLMNADLKNFLGATLTMIVGILKGLQMIFKTKKNGENGTAQYR
jgi:hypothetical protein